MKEGIEEFKGQKRPVAERLEELKQKEIKRMEEDPTHGGPWKNIEPGHLTLEVQDLYDLLGRNQLDVIRDKFREAGEKIEEMKNGKVKDSNTNFLQWINGRINVELSKKTLKDQREKENL